MQERKTLVEAVLLDPSDSSKGPVLPAGMLVRLEDQLREQVRHMPRAGYTLCFVYAASGLRWVPNEALAGDDDEGWPGPSDFKVITNLKAFQLSVADMWAAYTQMMRLINSESTVAEHHLMAAMVLYQSTSDMLTQAGGAIFSLCGDKAVELPPLADDVAAIKLSPFRTTVRQDKVFSDQLLAQAHILTDTCRSLSTDQRDSALAALIDAHLAAAQPLVQSFQQTVRVLSQGSHQ